MDYEHLHEHHRKVRKPNTEYRSPFICNLFYCFYFQFVCRRNAIQDEDIYDVHPNDRSDLMTRKGEAFWKKHCAQYYIQMEQYQRDKETHL